MTAFTIFIDLFLFTMMIVIFIQWDFFITSFKVLTYQSLAALLLVSAPLFDKMLSDHILQAKE